MSRLLFLLILSTLLFAEDFGRVTTSEASLFEFLSLNYDGRSAALGGVHSVFSTDRVLLNNFSRPVSIESGKGAVAASVKPYVLDIVSVSAGGYYTLPGDITLTPGFTYLSMGDINAVNEIGDSLDIAINPFSLKAGLGASYRFFDILTGSFGGNVVFESLTDSYSDAQIEENRHAALLFETHFGYQQNKVFLSGGIKNFGFYFSDNEYDFSLPVSLFSGLALTLPGEVPGTFFFETEKFLNSFLEFRGALELMPFGQWVALRAGSSVTAEEIRYIFSRLSSEASEDQDYSKRNWTVFSTGLGVEVPIQTQVAYVDGAVEFHGDGVGPSFSVSIGYIF